MTVRETALRNLQKANAARRARKEPSPTEVREPTRETRRAAAKSRAEVVALIRKKVESMLQQEAKGTLGDYIRLVQLEKELEGSDPGDVTAGWVDEAAREEDSEE